MKHMCMQSEEGIMALPNESSLDDSDQFTDINFIFTAKVPFA